MSTFKDEKTSYIGAIGSDASYSFTASVSGLPKCSKINQYEIVDLSPVGAITYPSASCMTDPCLSLDFDTTQVRDITFKVKPKDNLSMAPTSV